MSKKKVAIEEDLSPEEWDVKYQTEMNRVAYETTGYDRRDLSHIFGMAYDVMTDIIHDDKKRKEALDVLEGSCIEAFYLGKGKNFKERHDLKVKLRKHLDELTRASFGLS